MTYRNDKSRRNLQSRTINGNEGQTAIWRSFISAITGNQAAGYGLQPFYRQQIITIVFPRGADMNEQNQYPGGTIADAQFTINTRYPMGQRDEILWNNVRYRVDANSQKSPMDGMWQTVVKRGDNS